MRSDKRIAPSKNFRKQEIGRPAIEKHSLNLTNGRLDGDNSGAFSNRTNTSALGKSQNFIISSRLKKPVVNFSSHVLTEFSQRRLERFDQSMKAIEKIESDRFLEDYEMAIPDHTFIHEDSKRVTQIMPNRKTKISLVKDEARYFSVDYSDYRFPIRFDFSCESGCFFLYLSFTQDHPNRKRKDMSTRNSKFELLHPPNQKKETEALMARLVRIAAQQPKVPSDQPRTISMGKYVYFSTLPFKDLELSLLISCQPIDQGGKSNQQTEEALPEVNDLTDIKLLASRSKLASSRDRPDDILYRNKLIAPVAPNFTAENQRLFGMIQQKRIQATNLRKTAYHQTGIFRRPEDNYNLAGPKQIVRPEDRKIHRLTRQLQLFEKISNGWQKQIELRGKAFWIVLLCLRRIFMDIRNFRLQKRSKAEGYFDQLLTRLRLRKLANQFHERIGQQAESREVRGEPTLTLQLASIVLRLQYQNVASCVQKKALKCSRRTLAQICLKTKLRLCIDAIPFTKEMRQFFDYKEQRIQYYKSRWVGVQNALIHKSKELSAHFHDLLEKDINSYDPKFEAFQEKVLRLVYKREYVRFIEKKALLRKKINSSDPYTIDFARLGRWLDSQDYSHFIKKAEEMTVTQTGFDLLFDRGLTKKRKWGNLKACVDNKEDEIAFERIDKKGKLHVLLKFAAKMQSFYLRKKFIFTLEPGFLINLIVCCYHLDSDSELLDYRSKKMHSIEHF